MHDFEQYAISRLINNPGLPNNISKDYILSDGIIYHYTDLNGFKGIINDIGFYLSDSTMLNDREEIINGDNLLISIIDNFKANTFKEANLFLQNIKDISKKQKSTRVYVCCFSELPDSLDLWRTYTSDKVGVSLKFDIKDKNSFPTFIVPPRRLIFKVVYDDILKTEIIKYYLQQAIDELKLDIDNGRVYDDDLIQELADYVYPSIAWYFPLFKNKSFSSEKEIRMVYSWISSSVKKEFDEIHFRTSNWGLISYFKTNEEILFNSDKTRIKPSLLPLKEIIIGPTEHYLSIKQSLEYFLNLKGYKDISIIPSEVPLRKLNHGT